jgi:hypothetical protein
LLVHGRTIVVKRYFGNSYDEKKAKNIVENVGP